MDIYIKISFTLIAEIRGESGPTLWVYTRRRRFTARMKIGSKKDRNVTLAT